MTLYLANDDGGDAATRSAVVVAATPQDAFALFTGETSLWWRHDATVGADDVHLQVEPEQYGRLLAVSDSGGRVEEVGRVAISRPGRELVLSWRAGAETRIRFVPVAAGTAVEVEHRLAPATESARGVDQG